MKKFKKILTAAVAAAITTSAITTTSMAAPASYFATGGDARLNYDRAYAEMVNNRNANRYTYVKLVVKSKITGEEVKSGTNSDVLGLNESIGLDFYWLTGNSYESICSGSIYSSGSTNSPLDWSTTKTVK